MAVLFRCVLSPPSSSSPLGARRRRAELPPTGLDVMPQKQQGPITFSKVSMKFACPFDTAKIVSCCRSLTFSPAFIKFVSSEGVSKDLTRVSSRCDSDISNSHHQTPATPATFLKFLVGANALTFILPLDALAETQDPISSFFSMPVLFAIALIGATVGGLVARQRKAELARLNDQLRQINAALRRQAKIESYAPTLSYTPTTKFAEAEVVVDPRKEQLLAQLRAGKNFLRNQEPEKAFHEFKAAFDIAQTIGDHVDEKKAARGLGASLQRQGKYRDAIKYHTRVLEISKRAGEDSGSTEAYGAIADCYTELGDLERAGKFYDKYISRLESD